MKLYLLLDKNTHDLFVISVFFSDRTEEDIEKDLEKVGWSWQEQNQVRKQTGNFQNQIY